MGYPYGPQQGHDPYAGQVYAQPGYGPDPYGGQPGYAQPYGAPVQNGYGAPAYGGAPYPYAPGYGQRRPGGGTAITAAVIALLLSLTAALSLAIGVAAIVGTNDATGIETSAVAVPLIIGGGLSFLWFLGSILLFRRKAAGRAILIIMSAIAMLGLVVSAGLSINTAGGDFTPASITNSIGGLVALLILCLAAAPSTGRWVRAGRPSSYQQYPQY